MEYIKIIKCEENTEIRVHQSTHTGKYHVQLWDMDVRQPLPFCDIYKEKERALKRAETLADNRKPLTVEV